MAMLVSWSLARGDLSVDAGFRVKVQGEEDASDSAWRTSGELCWPPPVVAKRSLVPLDKGLSEAPGCDVSS